MFILFERFRHTPLLFVCVCVIPIMSYSSYLYANTIFCDSLLSQQMYAIRSAFLEVIMINVYIITSSQ